MSHSVVFVRVTVFVFFDIFHRFIHDINYLFSLLPYTNIRNDVHILQVESKGGVHLVGLGALIACLIFGAYRLVQIE